MLAKQRIFLNFVMKGSIGKTMRRLLILLIVTLFALCGLSAAVDPKTTDVTIKLDLDDEYLIDINTSEVKEGDTVISDSVGDTGIVLTYDTDSFVLESTSTHDTKYYISYIFKEYDPCRIRVKLDGDLRTSDSAPDNEKIPFEAVIKVASTSYELKSSSTDFVDIFSVSTAATKIDERIFGSFALEIKPSTEEGKNSLKDKKITSYTAHLILSVVGL